MDWQKLTKPSICCLKIGGNHSYIHNSSYNIRADIWGMYYKEHRIPSTSRQDYFLAITRNLGFLFDSTHLLLRVTDDTKIQKSHIFHLEIESLKIRELASLIGTLTLSWRRPLPYRNQYTDLLRKSMDWFLYDNGLRHERVNRLKGK